MRYLEIPVHTHRENPAHARSPGAAWLVRAGYLSHGGELLPLGKRVIERLTAGAASPDFFERLGLPLLRGEQETFFPLATGSTGILACPVCGYVHRRELAGARKTVFSTEPALPMEKVFTPDCASIESLARFLNVPEPKTAKSLMFVREADGQFLFAVVRGDMTLSEAKLASCAGKVRLATEAEIRNAGAVPGYASPVGVPKAFVVADPLIPLSPNLVAGANEAGYHLKNVNYGRDYRADLVTDVTLAGAGDLCITCGNALQFQNALVLSSCGANGVEFYFEQILSALAEAHHDEKGLTLPSCAAPFDVYLMQVQSKAVDTRSAAEELYSRLTGSGVAVLFDDRDERAGVKFNDADLIGCPIRVTVGERGLAQGMVEWKLRKATETIRVEIGEVPRKVSELT